MLRKRITTGLIALGIAITAGIAAAPSASAHDVWGFVSCRAPGGMTGTVTGQAHFGVGATNTVIIDANADQFISAGGNPKLGMIWRAADGNPAHTILSNYSLGTGGFVWINSYPPASYIATSENVLFRFTFHNPSDPSKYTIADVYANGSEYCWYFGGL